jgi:hypothetical protein
MTPATFRAELAALNLTVGGFATLTGLTRTTCEGWGRERSGRGRQAFPRWVPLLLAAWRAHPRLLVHAYHG